MKNILFYGDSNTWGFNPETHIRYPYEIRWTTICEKLLGSDFNCIPAGMNGRTTVFDDPLKGCRNGLSAIDYELQTHKPLDLIVVMLGTNDLKYTDAAGSTKGMEEVLQDILTANERFNLSYPVFPNGTKILLVSPILVEGEKWFGSFVNAAEESRKFAELYKSLADQLNCKIGADEKKRSMSKRDVDQTGMESKDAEKRFREIETKDHIYFLDASLVAAPSVLDGVHLALEGHAAIGGAIAEKIAEILPL